MLEKTTVLPEIPERTPESHKGSYGRVSVAGGALGMAGAVYMAAQGALLSGAGLVECLVPERIIDILSAKITSSVAKCFPSDSKGRFTGNSGELICEAVSDASAVAVGMGMGTGKGPEQVVGALIETCAAPLIIDADGLNCLSCMGCDILKQRNGKTLLTPHPGEMGRLTGKAVADIQNKRLETSIEFAEMFSVVVCLKGYETVVTDGSRYYINQTGNPGMAVGGSGDVLTGIIAGLTSSTGLDLFEAACAGTWIHGTAGDIAAQVVGQISLTAESIILNIHNACNRYTNN